MNIINILIFKKRIDKLKKKRDSIRLISCFRIDDQYIQEYASLALLEIIDNQIIEKLLNAIEDKDENVRFYSIHTLAHCNAHFDVNRIIESLGDSSESVQGRAASALGELEVKGSINALIDLLNDEGTCEGVRCLAATSLGEIKNKKATPHLINTLKHHENRSVIRSDHSQFSVMDRDNVNYKIKGGLPEAAAWALLKIEDSTAIIPLKNAGFNEVSNKLNYKVLANINEFTKEKNEIIDNFNKKQENGSLSNDDIIKIQKISEELQLLREKSTYINDGNEIEQLIELLNTIEKLRPNISDSVINRSFNSMEGDDS